MNGEPHHIKVYNLPQNIEGGIKLHGFNSPDYDLPKDSVLLFHRLDGMYGICTVEATNDEISISAQTPIVELGGDEYQIEETPDEETDKSY